MASFTITRDTFFSSAPAVMAAYRRMRLSATLLSAVSQILPSSSAIHPSFPFGIFFVLTAPIQRPKSPSRWPCRSSAQGVEGFLAAGFPAWLVRRREAQGIDKTKRRRVSRA